MRRTTDMGTPDEPSPASESSMGADETGKQLFRGPAWMVLLRWVMRGIGLVSTLILVRLLTREDFGLVAMAVVGVGLLEVFTHAGVDLALIRNRTASREHFNTAWTISFLLGAALALVLLLIAPLAGYYFDEPRVVVIIRVLAIRALVGGLENIGVVAFRRDLRFGTEFRFEVSKKLLNFVTVITSALILRNYWALVIGMVLGRILAVLLSYVAHPYRPRPSLAKASEIWMFSGWLILFRVGRYLNGKTDRFILGGIAGAEPTGTYHVAAEIATAPTDELVFPMARGLFPVYSKMSGDPGLLASSFLKVFSVITMLCIAAGMGMAVVADDLVRVVLGQKWISAIPLVRALAVFGTISGITGAFETLLTVRGRVRALAAVTWFSFGLQVPALWVAGSGWGAEGVALSRLGVAVVVAPLVVFVAKAGFPLAIGKIASTLFDRLLAGGVMILAVRTLHWESIDIPALRLGLDVVIGAIAFTTATLAIWKLRGAPDGPEQALLATLKSKLRRKS